MRTFELIKKKYALNNSYFKATYYYHPQDVYEVLGYLKQHGELPFKGLEGNEYWIYETFIEYQKRVRVELSQYFTPPKTAKLLAEIALKYFTNENEVILDACCGFGALSYELKKEGRTCIGFDGCYNMGALYTHFTGFEFENNSFEFYKKQHKYIVANPPYEIPLLTAFLEKLHNNMLSDNGTAVLLMPKDFVKKDKPKALVEILNKFNVCEVEAMQEQFALTGINAEIVVLRKL